MLSYSVADTAPVRPRELDDASVAALQVAFGMHWDPGTASDTLPDPNTAIDPVSEPKLANSNVAAIVIPEVYVLAASLGGVYPEEGTSLRADTVQLKVMRERGRLRLRRASSWEMVRKAGSKVSRR